MKSDSDGDPVVGPVPIVDKRGKGKPSPEMPTAEELLDSTPANPALAAQLAEEQERRAAWEAMSDEERQALLAQQAAEEAGTPFAGGGVQTPPNEEAGKQAVLTMFTVVVHRDGTAWATDDLDLSKYEPEFPVDGNMIYRAVCEIKKDIESTDAATMTMRFMNQQMQALAQQEQGRALASQLDQRGLRTPQPPPRGRRR